MLFSLLTVVFYAASSLGDKFISAKLDCNAREFSFLVSAATALFLVLMLPFLGWSFAFSWRALVILLLLIAFKIGEFYMSAYLLKTVSAYELKAWLSINVILSFLVDLGRGKETFFWAFIPCAAALLVGIGMIAFAHRSEGEDVKKAGCLYILFSPCLHRLQIPVRTCDQRAQLNQRGLPRFRPAPRDGGRGTSAAPVRAI